MRLFLISICLVNFAFAYHLKQEASVSVVSDKGHSIYISDKTVLDIDYKKSYNHAEIEFIYNKVKDTHEFTGKFMYRYSHKISDGLKWYVLTDIGHGTDKALKNGYSLGLNAHVFKLISLYSGYKGILEFEGKTKYRHNIVLSGELNFLMFIFKAEFMKDLTRKGYYEFSIEPALIFDLNDKFSVKISNKTSYQEECYKNVLLLGMLFELE